MIRVFAAAMLCVTFASFARAQGVSSKSDKAWTTPEGISAEALKTESPVGR